MRAQVKGNSQKIQKKIRQKKLKNQKNIYNKASSETETESNMKREQATDLKLTDLFLAWPEEEKRRVGKGRWGRFFFWLVAGKTGKKAAGNSYTAI